MVLTNPITLLASIIYFVIILYSLVTGDEPSVSSWYVNTGTLAFVTFIVSFERK